MGTLSIILRRSPYGSVDAPEAIRHALGGVTEDMAVNLILMGGGVNAVRRGQDISGTEYLSAEDGIRDCIDMGVSVYADGPAFDEERIAGSDVIAGVQRIDVVKAGEILKASETVMIF